MTPSWTLILVSRGPIPTFIRHLGFDMCVYVTLLFLSEYDHFVYERLHSIARIH